MKLSNSLAQIVGISISFIATAHSANDAQSLAGYELFDIANQAYIVTWDIQNSNSSHPRRTEQLEIDDLFFDRFVFPRNDGNYMLPTMPTTGYGVIGFQWYDKRFVSQLYTEFAIPQSIPSEKYVRLEYWIGDSVFDGQWVPLPGKLIKEPKGLRYIIADKNCKAASEGTFKIRWYFAEAIPSYIFTKLQALTNFSWQSTTLNIEIETPNGCPVNIQFYNALLIEPQSNTTILQLEPSKINTIKLKYCLNGNRNTERSTITFDMGAQHLVALGVLPPDAKDGYFKANRFEDYDFQLPCTDFPADKIKQDWFNFAGFYRGQPYYPRITDVYALNDDVKPFIRSCFNNIMPIINTELLTFWEHFRATGGWNKTHETGWFLQQTRMMLIREEDNTLWLAPFVPNNWTQEGMKVVAQNMPTTFGTVSFEITSHVENGFIKAVITPPKRSKSELIIIRLRHPQQKPIRSVTVNGSPHDNFDPAREIIRINSMPQNIEVEAHY